ncbi:hypothetical protein KJ866_00485 [Patescibacteria group bacterium]|nr:hypothetical protein [Patescibacteria group bacterium]
MLGCAIGAFIGVLVAFEIQSRLIWGSYLWILGAFAGGLIGWCAGELKELWTSIMHSYHETINWRPDHSYWKAFIILFSGIVLMSITVCGFMLLPILILASEIHSVWLLVGLGGAGMFYSLAMTLLLIGNNPTSFEDATKIGRTFMRQCNPIASMYYIFRFLYRIVRYLILHLPSATVAICSAIKWIAINVAQFVARVFIYAHSERRRIRFIGAFLGTVAGFFLGSAILGAVAGAIIGGISREIAIRWLKLVPSV